MKNLLVLALTAVVTKPGMAASTFGFSAAMAAVTEADPWPWVIGALGASIVYAKRPATSRLDALANSIISVMLAGIIAPVASAAAGKYVGPEVASEYAIAFVMASLWPWVLPALIAKLKGKIDAL